MGLGESGARGGKPGVIVPCVIKKLPSRRGWTGGTAVFISMFVGGELLGRSVRMEPHRPKSEDLILHRVAGEGFVACQAWHTCKYVAYSHGGGGGGPFKHSGCPRKSGLKQW